MADTSSRRSFFVNTVWVILVLCSIGILVASLPGYTSQLSNSSLMNVDASPVYINSVRLLNILTSIGTACLCIILSAILFWRKRTDRMAVFLSFYLLGYGIILSGPLEAIGAFMPGGWNSFVITIQGALFTAPTILIFYLLPNGRFVPRWTRFAALASLIYFPVAFFISPGNLISGKTIFVSLSTFGYVALLSIGVYSQVYRYRKISTINEQLQSKVFIFGLLLWIFLLIPVSVPFVALQNLPVGASQPWWAPLSQLVWFVSLMVLPITLTVAILRYRLWDIDILIRRTLVYSILTAILAIVYWGGVTLLQSVFSFFSGETPPAAIVISTLTIATLFNPLRRRLQILIDHRFYRSKYDTEKTLAAFSAHLREEVNLDDLSSHLTSVVKETIQPAHVSLYLLGRSSAATAGNSFKRSH